MKNSNLDSANSFNLVNAINMHLNTVNELLEKKISLCKDPDLKYSLLGVHSENVKTQIVLDENSVGGDYWKKGFNKLSNDNTNSTDS